MKVFSLFRKHQLPMTWVGIACIALATFLLPQVNGRPRVILQEDCPVFQSFTPLSEVAALADLSFGKGLSSVDDDAWSEMHSDPSNPQENEGAPSGTNPLLEEEVLEEFAACSPASQGMAAAARISPNWRWRAAFFLSPCLRAAGEPPEWAALLPVAVTC
jgi:hypothetical protein